MIIELDKLTEDEQVILWLGSFRYYCGRTSYAVGNFTELLIRQWPNLSPHVKNFIKRDLEEEFRRDDASRLRREMQDLDRAAWYNPLGHDCDRACWEQVRILWEAKAPGTTLPDAL